MTVGGCMRPGQEVKGRARADDGIDDGIDYGAVDAAPLDAWG